MLSRTIAVMIIAALTMAAAPGFDTARTADAIAAKIKPRLPDGWSVVVEKNSTLTITRQKPIEWYGTISLPPHNDKADLKAQGFINTGTYTITIEFGPPLTQEQVTRLIDENRKIIEDYERQHPPDPHAKPTAPPKEVTDKLHHIPNVLTGSFSALLTPFVQGAMAFYNDEDEAECRRVEQAVRRLLIQGDTA